MEEYEDAPSLQVHADDVQRTLQYFFDNTEWGVKCGGRLHIEQKEWDQILHEFKQYFKKDPITNEYELTESKLYDFINNQIYVMVENTMFHMTDAGLVDMVVDSEGNICFQNKKG